jgi:hypothetical protein
MVSFVARWGHQILLGGSAVVNLLLIWELL